MRCAVGRRLWSDYAATERSRRTSTSSTSATHAATSWASFGGTAFPICFAISVHFWSVGKHEVVGEAHAARGLADRDRPVLARVQVATLLGLVELGPDRERRPIPVEPSEDVGRPGRLVAPARRDEVTESGGVEACLHLEAVSAVVRDVLVADDASRAAGCDRCASPSRSACAAAPSRRRGRCSTADRPSGIARRGRSASRPATGHAPPRTPMTIARRRRCGTP